MSSTTVSVFPLALLAVLLVYVWKRRATTSQLPPGPPGYPIIGNIYDIPQDHAWFTYNQWAHKYGDVMRVEVFGKTTIILNSFKAAIELLDKRSSNYSDRPRLVMADELIGWEWDFAHMSHSDRWRRHRRYFHQHFQPRNLASYYPIQKKVTVHLLWQLIESPQNFLAHIRQHVGSVVLGAAYGYEVKAENDFYIALVHKAMKPLLITVHAGHYVVDYLPFLKHIPSWLPGAGFKRNAAKWATDTRALRDIPFNNVKEAMANGTGTQCFVTDNLDKIAYDDNISNKDEEAEIIRNCAGMVYTAGSDTTVSLVQSWILAMAHYPEIQRKAQEEVDRIVGDSRLPEFEDRSSMPYVEAVLLETIRWGVVTPLALPHRVVADDVYEGYRIPAGATVVANAWAILHDEELYPNPFKFDPERFLEGGKVVHTQPDPTTVGAFGFGRRICPGRYLATNSAWISMTSILATFNISKSTAPDGNIIEPQILYEDGLVSHPKPFSVSFVPRSESSRKLIEVAKLEL